ncbi:MAG: cadherin repeat domain-containing protein, partial [Limnohabitans sp.]
MSKQIVAKNFASNAVAQPIATGKKSIIGIAKGQHLKVQDVVANQAKDASDVVVTKAGQALRLKFADGTEIEFAGFYDECGANACSVTVAGKESGGYTIQGDTALGAATSDSGQLVYAYGDHNSLMALANGDSGMSGALARLGDGLVAYVPGDVSAIAGMSPGALAGLGGGLALAAAGGGGGASATAPIVSIVSGTIVAGPVLAGHGLSVEVYAANGTTLLGTATVDENGQFTVNVGSYVGVVIAKVVDANSNADYMDESTGSGKDLNATLMATAVVPGGNVTVNINVLTTVAALKAGMNSDGTVGTALTSTSVNNANNATAAAFGLTDLLDETIVTTVDTTGGTNSAYDTTDGLSNAEQYGAVLAALSGADANNAGDVQATIDSIADGLTVSGSTGTLDSSAIDTLIAGAHRTDPSNSQNLVDIISNTTTQTSANIAIGTVAIDNIINSSETSAVVSGTAAANAVLTLSLGGNTRTVTADANGAWSYTLVEGDIDDMGQGAESIGVSDGNSTATRGVFIDTVAPVITSGSEATTIDENSGAGQVVYTVSASDGADISDGVTYSLGEDADGALFSINATTGAVTLTGNPDHETQSSYSFTVIATDAAGNTDSQVVTLGINDLDEADPVITSGSEATTINENSG